MTHDFDACARWSTEASDEPFWEAVYRKAFPDLVAMMACPGDTQAQRRGIDRVILLGSGQVLRVEEKKRRRDYGDFLLETVSVSTTGAPGWMNKPLAIDYLAYAFMPSRRVYVLPWLLLRRAWLHFGSAWIKYYPRIEAKNNGYTTISVAVPISVVLGALRRAQVIQI